MRRKTAEELSSRRVAKRIVARVRSILRKQNTETRLSAATEQQQRARKYTACRL